MKEVTYTKRSRSETDQAVRVRFISTTQKSVKHRRRPTFYIRAKGGEKGPLGRKELAYKLGLNALELVKEVRKQPSL
jgi:hypothetical protein